MLTLTIILVVAALIIAIWSAVSSKPVLWVSVVLIAIAILLPLVPAR